MLPVTLGQGRFSLLAVAMVALLAMDPGAGWAARKGAAAKPAKEKIVAEMGEVRLSADHLKELMVNLDPEDRSRLSADPNALRKVVAEELVRQFLINQARKEGWEKKPSVRAIMKRVADEALFTQYMLDKVAPEASFPSDEVVKEVFEKNKDRLLRSDRVHLAQIFLASVVDGTPRSDMENRLEKLRSRLDGDEFSEVAKELSDHKESADKGGDLGWQSMSGLGPELRPIVSGLKPGEVSPPLKSGRGWHVFKLVEREVGTPLSLEEARPAIIDSLRSNMAKNKEGLFLEEVVNRNPPKINEEVLQEVLGK